MAEEELPPIYVQFKADIAQLMQSLQQIEAGLGNFQTTADNAGTAAQGLGAKTVAAGILMANVLSNLYAKAKAFGMETITAFSSVAGEVGKMRKVLGGSAEDMSQLRFAAEETGVESGKLIIGLRTLSRHLTTNDTAIRSLGINYRDANGKIKPTKEVLALIADRFAAMPNGIEKTALATRLFGRAGIDLISTLNLGSAGLQKLYAQADKLGLQLSGKDLEASKAYTIAKREMHAAIEGVQVSIGRELLPRLAALTQYVNENVIPKIKALVDGFIGNNSLRKGLSESEEGMYNFGNRIRNLVGFIVHFRNQLLMLGTVLGAIWITTKIIAGVEALLTVIGTLRKAYNALKISALAAWVAESLAINPFLGLAVATAGIAAFTFLIEKLNSALDNADFKLPELKLPEGTGDLEPWSPPTDEELNADANRTKSFLETIQEQALQFRYRMRLLKMGASKDFISALLGSENWQTEADKILNGGKTVLAKYMQIWRNTEAGRKEMYQQQYDDEMKRLGKIAQKIQSIDANATLSFATMQNRGFRERITDMQYYIKQAGAAVKAAQAEEVKTRGTKAHYEAVNILNNAIAEQAKLQATANQMIEENAKAVAEQNRQQALLNNTMSASNSYLAAQVRTAGVTAQQAGSFIEVPVIIDGQTVFRVVQKHSLINDRRNVANGLSKSGSTIG